MLKHFVYLSHYLLPMTFSRELIAIVFLQKAWEVAQAPSKNLLMMGFMMWMAGSTVHLFSIGITFSALWQPISALQGVGKGRDPIYITNTTFCCVCSMTDLDYCQTKLN